MDFKLTRCSLDLSSGYFPSALAFCYIFQSQGISLELLKRFAKASLISFPISFSMPAYGLSLLLVLQIPSFLLTIPDLISWFLNSSSSALSNQILA